MISIPPEVKIRASIKPGSVYYFSEDRFHSQKPHYFIVVNLDPFNDVAILLVWASSQTQKVRKRRCSCPAATLVDIGPTQYADFRVNSIVDCNYVVEKSIDELVEKLAQGKLKMKTEMDISIVKQLRGGILCSPLIERRIKAVLEE